MIVFALAAVVIGFTGMIFASRAAVTSAAGLVAGTHIPPFVIGTTLLAIGTDLPEIANSIAASWSGHGDVNVGDSLGSAATQLTLVLGLLPIIVGPILVVSRGIGLTGWLTVAGVGTVVLLTSDDLFGRTDALLLIGMWLLGSWLIYRRASEPVQLSLPDEPAPRGGLVGLMFVAFVGLATAAMVALWGIIETAEQLDMPEFVVSFFLASLGTSLPELVFDVTAIRRGESELAIGDIFGSSFIDATLAVAIGPLLFPTSVTSGNIQLAGLAAMIAIAIVTVTVTRIREHDWRTGVFFIALYCGFFLILL
ncbi:MAG: sodium:calcium antiporter [Acidimicrobiales bacterium]